MTDSVEKGFFERAGVIVGLVAATVMLMGSIWSGVFGVAKLSVEFRAGQKEMTKMAAVATQQTKNIADMLKAQQQIAAQLKTINTSALRVVYVDKDSIVLTQTDAVFDYKVPMERVGG